MQKKHTVTSGRICLVFIFTILLALSLLMQNAYAFTYESQDWWFAREQQTQVTGDLGIIFTYPDRVIENDRIDVNVRIEYMNNENAQGEYAILDDVKIHVRNNNTRLNGDIHSSENVTSPILRPGQIFSHNYSIPTQHMGLEPGNLYAIDLSFTVSFGMKTKVETYYWDSGEMFGNSIEPQELRPFEVVAKNSTAGNELTLRINRPFGLLKPVVVLIDNKPFIMEGGAVTNNVLGPGTTHSIKMNETIPLLRDDNKGLDVMRAKFTSWSDGSKNTQREVDVNKNTELFAIYITQYYLDVTSVVPSGDYLNNTVVGEGWYNAGSRAQFSVQNLGTDWLFDHWTGDIGSDIDRSSPSNSIIMDGPKTIQAQLKQNDIIQAFETNRDFLIGFIVSAIIAPLAVWYLSVLYSRKETKRNLIYLNTYIPLINDILRQNIKERDVCLTLLDQKRKEITKLLQAGIISVETFRVLNERITESFREVFDISQK